MGLRSVVSQSIRVGSESLSALPSTTSSRVLQLNVYVCLSLNPISYLKHTSNPAIENMNLALGYSEYEGIPLDGSS